jgi:hypothetical protein
MTTAITKEQLKKQDYKNYLQNGIGYSRYKQQMAEDLAMNRALVW